MLCQDAYDTASDNTKHISSSEFSLYWTYLIPSKCTTPDWRVGIS